MPQAPKTPKKPSPAIYRSRRWPVVAALAITAVMTAAAALAAISSLPAPASALTAPAAPPAAATVPGPAPAIGQPFYANMPDRSVATITIRSAAFTAPGRLVLDTAWEAYVGTATSDPAWFEVRDAAGHRLAPVPAGNGALEPGPVTPGTPRHGLVAYNTDGPATLVLTDTSHMQPTYIAIKP